MSLAHSSISAMVQYIKLMYEGFSFFLFCVSCTDASVLVSVQLKASVTAAIETAHCVSTELVARSNPIAVCALIDICREKCNVMILPLADQKPPADYIRTATVELVVEFVSIVTGTGVAAYVVVAVVVTSVATLSTLIHVCAFTRAIVKLMAKNCSIIRFSVLHTIAVALI